MSFLLSLLIALGLGVAAMFLGGFLANKATRWLNVSQREGYAAYWLVFRALLFGALGAIAGFVAARNAQGEERFLTLALGAAVALGLPLLWALFAWASSDRQPRLKGKSVGLDLELRAPPGVSIAENSSQLYSYLSASRARMEASKLDFAGQQQIDGCWVLPGFVRLHTSRPNPYIAFGGERMGATNLYFHLDLPRPLKSTGRTWSEWKKGQLGGGTPSADAALFELRYRLRSL